MIFKKQSYLTCQIRIGLLTLQTSKSDNIEGYYY